MSLKQIQQDFTKEHDTENTTSMEFYGFALYVASWLGFCTSHWIQLIKIVMWIAWAFFPDAWLHAVGVTYYPNRYWSIAIPLWITYCVPFAMILFLSWTLRHTPGLESRNTMLDQWSLVADTAEDWESEYVLLRDVPIHLVNQKLYG